MKKTYSSDAAEFEDYFEFLRSFISYYKRSDLSAFEKNVIRRYQDIHPENKQKQWSVPIPKNWNKKTDCYVFNSSCRFEKFYPALLKHEQEDVFQCLCALDNAILKSFIFEDLFIYRGVFDIDWLGPLFVGLTFTEKAYGSFSLFPKQAYNYVNPLNPIIFQKILSSKMNWYEEA